MASKIGNHTTRRRLVVQMAAFTLGALIPNIVRCL